MCQILFNKAGINLKNLGYIHGKDMCCRIALNLFKIERTSVAEVRISALF